MKTNKKEQRKRRVAAIVAVILVMAMVFSLIAPIFSARAAEAPKTSADRVLKEGEQLEEIGTNDFSSNVFIGFEQQYIVGNTAPISTILVNNGKDFKGNFQIKIYSYLGAANEDRQYSLYYQTLELPKGAGKQINMAVPIKTLQRQFEITLTDEKGNIVYRKYASAKPLDPATLLVGVLSERPTDMSYFSAIHFAQQEDYTEEYTKTVYLTGETFPSITEVMNHFKVIVIDDFDTKILTEEQKNALLEWIKQGGICVIGTGVNAQKTLEGLQNIISVSCDSVVNQYIRMAGTRVRADVAQLEIQQDNSEAIENASILPVGSGSVVLYDISLSLSPATETTGFINEIRDCCESLSSALTEIKYQDSYSYNPIAYVARSFPEWERGPIYMILLAIAIYIIVVGPVIYLILKKKDKREKGWVVIPATSVIFMLIVFVLSFNSHYKSGMLNIVSSTKLEQGQSIGKTDIYVSAKTSKKGNVHISADEFINVSIPSEDRWNYSETAKDICMNKIRVGEKTEVTYLDTKSWQNSDFELETTTDLSGILDCNFKMKDDKIVGSIANHTNRNFREIVVLAGQKIFMIDNLKIGQTYQVEEDITDKEYLSDVSNAKSSRILLQLFRDMYSRDTLNDRIKKGEITRQDAYRIMRESDMINNFMDMGASTYVKNTGDIHVFLYAFDEENILPQTFYINGETALENTLNLYRIEHSIRLAETENFAIPFGILTGIEQGEEKIVNNDIDIDYYGNNRLYARKNVEAVWEFPLPADTIIESFQFRSMNDAGNYYQAPEIYNVRLSAWESLESGEYTNAADYINFSEKYPNGHIMVKYFIQRETEVQYPDIKLKGAGQNVGN